jgi:translation initiation factor IF-3
MKTNNFSNNRKNQPKHKINSNIRCSEVRLIGYFDEPKLIKTEEAQKIAHSEELDLVLINENQTPPIAKIIDYKKFLYDTERAEKERKKNSNKSTVKEIQLSVDIAENDLNTKSRKAIEFLKNGDKVKCSLMLKGRQKSSPERGELTMLKFVTLVEEHGSLESLPILQGGKWNMMIKPKKKS